MSIARVRIAAYGDSLVEGWGLAPADALPAQLEAELIRSGMNARVLNFGVSGETAPEGLLRLPEVLEAMPQAAILEFGANDCYQGVPVEETEKALADMLHGLLGAGVAVLLAGWRTREDLFSQYQDDPALAGMIPLAPPFFNAEYVRRFNEIHPALAKRFGLPLIPHILDPLAPQQDGQPYFFQADGVHPSAAGTRVLAGVLAQALRPLLA
ncbi:MAG: arylesterase [Proteobacteria bacterium]|nr:arylesterase [Pseudomonadota bacterium]MBU1595880.1 arylesterase [Pseudomonadota bacterium]